MAIIIPSKSIYDIENQKVLNNVIDRIEVNATDILPKNGYNVSVYDERIITSPMRYNRQQNGKTNWAETRVYTENDTALGQFIYGEAYAFSLITGIYWQGTVRIYKNYDNQLIQNIYAGVETINEVETPQVKYSIYSKKRNGSVTAYGQVNDTIPPEDLTQEKVVIYDSIERNMEDLTSDTLLTLPIKSQSCTFSYNHYFENYDKDMAISATVAPFQYSDTITNLDNLNIREGTDNGKGYYEFDITVLCGCIIDYLGCSNFAEYGGGEKSDTPRDLTFIGYCEYYEPNYIELAVYGDTIGIELKDKVLNISKDGNEDSKYVTSISNNELLQTTNYFTNGAENGAITEEITKTITKYESGVETAEILCSINDYKGENGELVINPNGKNLIDHNLFAKSSKFMVSQNGTIYGAVAEDTIVNDYLNSDIYLDLQKGTYYFSLGARYISNSEANFIVIDKDNNILLSARDNDWSGSFTLSKDTKVGILLKLFNKSSGSYDVVQLMLTKGKPSSFEKYLPMCFKENDIVVPMIYQADRTDKAMSIKNGANKSFKVVGTEIYYDGAVWQKLYVQENK